MELTLGELKRFVDRNINKLGHGVTVRVAVGDQVWNAVRVGTDGGMLIIYADDD